MPFKTSRTVKKALTHTQYFTKFPEKAGESTPIVRVMYNDEWKTITFFGREWKLNFKYPNAQELMDTWLELGKELKQTNISALLIDSSCPEDKEYECIVDIRKAKKGENGVSFTVHNGIWTLDEAIEDDPI